MRDLVVLGTDTDAGKTTFALLWLTAFADQFAYWKPLETGPSDTDSVRGLVPLATVLEPNAHFAESVAPLLAARHEGRLVPTAEQLAASRPTADLPLLIETFGGPFSPLNETESQLEFVRRLDACNLLVSPSSVGAIGRCTAMISALRSEGLQVAAVVLLGPRDPFAEAELQRRCAVQVVSLSPPALWNVESLKAAVSEQTAELSLLKACWVAAERAESLPHRSSEDLIGRDAAAVWHPYTSLRNPGPPLAVVGAQDEFIELADGRRLIDGISSWWTILHGHRYPRLMAALRTASARFDHVLFAGATHLPAVECAELLLKTVPWRGGRVFYSDNGSTAVEVALKMAYQFWCHRGEPQRQLFVGFEDSYHGDTFGAMAVGRDPLFFGRFEPLLFRAERIPVSPDRLDDLLANRGAEVAAVIIEPLVQGAGGMRMHSAETLRDLHAVARRHDVLFIVDEVMTCGRTGTFWAHEKAQIDPDLICAAKTLAGGILPLAVTLASPKVVHAFDVADRSQTFFHGHSFTAHPLSCAVAAENLHMMSNTEWQAESTRINRHWNATGSILHELPKVADVRVCGTILAVDVDGPTGYLAEAGKQMRDACIDHGVMLRPLGNVLYSLPPLCTSNDSLDQIVEAMRAAILAVGH